MNENRKMVFVSIFYTRSYFNIIFTFLFKFFILNGHRLTKCQVIVSEGARRVIELSQEV